MVKIKVEKKMNLAELVQWAWDNPKLSKGKVFTSYKNDEDLFFKVVFNHAGNMNLEDSDGYCPKKDTLFPVEVEEEITEETEIPRLLEIFYKSSGDINVLVYGNASIKDVHDEYKNPLAYHMIYPDGTTTLLWTREGGMVE